MSPQATAADRCETQLITTLTDAEIWDDWNRALSDLPAHTQSESAAQSESAFAHLLDDAPSSLLPSMMAQPVVALATAPPLQLPAQPLQVLPPLPLAVVKAKAPSSSKTKSATGKRKARKGAAATAGDNDDDDDDGEFDAFDDDAAVGDDDDAFGGDDAVSGARGKRKKTTAAKPRGKKAATAAAAAAAGHSVTDEDVDAAFAQHEHASNAPKRRIVSADANRLLSLSLEHGDVTPSARDSLAVVNAGGAQISSAIDRLRGEIAMISPVGERDDATRARAKALAEQLPEVLQNVAKTRRDIDALCGQVVLRPEEFSITQHLLVSLKMHEAQIKLFERELTFLHTFTGGRMPNCLALVIAAQPFPMSYMYRKRIMEEVVVKLLTGAHANFLIGDAKAQIVADSAAAEQSVKGKNAENPIDKAAATFDRDGHATFVEMSFKSGSRKLPIRLQFAAQVDDTVRPGDASAGRAAKLHAPFEIQSDLSESFVVMTHENQWVETVGMLLRTALFGANGQGTVTWQRFCNVFQHHVLLTTRQDPDHPKRPLALAELAHFHTQHFGRKATIEVKALEKFWQWFGPALNRLHFKRHLSSLWADGVIGGFMSRADAEAALQNAAVGTFIVRFSDTREGQFVISYVPKNRNEEPFMHFLVPLHHTDERSFPDCLRDWEQFSSVLKTPTHARGVLMQRERTYECVPKSDLLSPYYSKKKVQSGADIGYQDNPV